VLNLVFKYADDHGLLLLDLNDLRAALQWVGDNRTMLTTEYGTVSPASIGAIQRSLLRLEEEGAERLFDEPSLKLADFMRTGPDGRGMINIIASDRLLLDPGLYAMFLLYLLAELFETMPEVGDLEKLKLVFFFDEAHLLFKDAPHALVDKIEQVVRLIRSKGVGVYFVTQNPIDLPDTVLGQLGNRVQHALRAYTPRDQNAVRAAAETFRTNPDIDVETAISELGISEALVSFLGEDGAPGIVQRAFILPPESKIGPIDATERQAMIQASPLHVAYEQAIDRRSAFEMLKERAAQAGQDVAAADEAERLAKLEAEVEKERQAELERLEKERRKEATRLERERQKELERLDREVTRRSRQSSKQSDSVTDILGDAVEAFGTSAGRTLVRGILGSLTSGKKQW
jgi:DNA helicase HerA-like ATPase